MVEVAIQDNTWQGLVQVARRCRKKPERLADDVLRDYLQRQADEDLLARSSHAAQRTAFPIGETEKIIRQHRQRKKKK